MISVVSADVSTGEIGNILIIAGLLLAGVSFLVFTISLIISIINNPKRKINAKKETSVSTVSSGPEAVSEIKEKEPAESDETDLFTEGKTDADETDLYSESETESDETASFAKTM